MIRLYLLIISLFSIEFIYSEVIIEPKIVQEKYFEYKKNNELLSKPTSPTFPYLPLGNKLRELLPVYPVKSICSADISIKRRICDLVLQIIHLSFIQSKMKENQVCEKKKFVTSDGKLEETRVLACPVLLENDSETLYFISQALENSFNNLFGYYMVSDKIIGLDTYFENIEI